ncbi:MAG TPA: aminotransferase class I/II-fold pyridoxal phosphate-dependent enzyme, partial [Longimicrobiales bacterium]|nr:aminotransferase class I/II-fold pyridoxal phosphate-dependent enzyme [Longimicrobiales bacterium]
TLHQYALAIYLERALEDGSLETYLDRTSALYRRAAETTVRCVREHLDMPCLDPEGGLYTVVDVGADADRFVHRVLAETGVILVPGRGFGPSLAEAVRISYGPLATDPDRIEEGIRRVGRLRGR